MPSQTIPKRLLVVDDDQMSRELLTVLLEAENYAVDSADSGEAALALIRRGESIPDLVLADVQMPGIAGSDLARELRLACGAQTLLLAMSGSQPPGEAISNFDGFLLKPFRMAEIAALLTRGAGSAPVPVPTTAEKRGVAAGSAQISKSRSKLVPIRSPAAQTASNSGTGGSTQDAPSPETGIGTGKSADSAPVLNEKIYGQIAVRMSERQLREMYALCVNDARKRIASMRGLAAARDRARFVREAHDIKGSCAMLGATELHGLAAQLEASGLESVDAEGTQDVHSLDELEAACDRLERLLGARV